MNKRKTPEGPNKGGPKDIAAVLRQCAAKFDRQAARAMGLRDRDLADRLTELAERTEAVAKLSEVPSSDRSSGAKFLDQTTE